MAGQATKQMMPQKKNGEAQTIRRRILIAAAECAPFAKTGGLADVVGALPGHLAPLGYDARVIMPFHRVAKERYGGRVRHLRSFSVDLGWRSQYVGLEQLELDGALFYFIDNEFYFGDRIYRGQEAEGEQYAFFCRAVMEALPYLDFEPDVIHANDWHTAMLPMLVKTQYQGKPGGGARTLLTIHNLFYQGKFTFSFVRDLLAVEDRYLTSEYMEHYGLANFLKAGCVFADRINTVSPTYAEEIKTEYFGEGLQGILNARSQQLSGVLNGIDYSVYDPAADASLPWPYNMDDLTGKYRTKEAVLEELGLYQADVNTPLLAMISRMTAQKGFDLVECVLDELMREDMAVIILGSGDAEYENFFRAAEQRYKGRLCAYIAYREDLAHRIYAAADYLLMPSRFEPCGLAQMIAMRYGTLPIVRETGGLKDTVIPYNKYTGAGTGFSFANYNAHEMADAVRRALAVYRDKTEMAALVAQAMAADFSFDRAAAGYSALYRLLLGD